MTSECESDCFERWEFECDFLNRNADQIDLGERNCIVSMLQNPTTFKTLTAVEFLDMHFNFFTLHQDSITLPEPLTPRQMFQVKNFLNQWKTEWFWASESHNWFENMFKTKRYYRKGHHLWNHFIEMRKLLDEKLKIETLTTAYQSAYLEQTVPAHVSPTHTATCYYSDSTSSGSQSPPNSSLSFSECHGGEIVPPMSSSWDGEEFASLCLGDNDLETVRR